MNSSKIPVKDTFDISWIQKDMRCWVYMPNQMEGDIYRKGVIKGIILQSINKANSRISGVLESGVSFESKASQIQKCRDSNSIEKDLIEMDIINAPQVLLQLKRRLAERKIHTCLWNSLIIVNPFRLIPDQYSQKSLSYYFENIFIKKEDIRHHEPHIFSFMFQILENLDISEKTQVINISGQSGSGKTQTNKQALKAISYCCGKVQQHSVNEKILVNMETKVLKCDPILQVFGNAKTIKNDNSSRFGKLITLKMNGQTMKIYNSSIKNYFLEKSRIISQNQGQRNFHIFYQFLAFINEDQRSQFKLKSNTGYIYKAQDFNYITMKQTSQRGILASDRQMWQNLNQAFNSLQFSKQILNQIWSIVAAVLLLGNITFDSLLQSETEPCDIRNPELAQNVSNLLGLDKKQFITSLVLHRRTIAAEEYLSPLNQKQCLEGRDSMSKAIYQSLFQWLVQQLNRKLNISHPLQQNIRLLKLLDIYGFQVFDHNSFEQLCVNYTNQKIHQIYLQQVFIHEKDTLKKQGLESIISKLHFTDNIKIIQILDSLNKSIFNLLDESCSVNVKDDDFLANIKKFHDQNQQFPPSNYTISKKSFIIRHTPGDIQYMSEGFRDKNKDLIRQDIVVKLSKAKSKIINQKFKERAEILKLQTNKRFLGLKIRKQVKQLISQMSTNTDLHFIRCLKPNEKKEPFLFVDRVGFNQIKYLGILDTIQMRKESYHIRLLYHKFYQKYGILQNKINMLIALQDGKISPYQCKDMTVNFVNSYFLNYNLDYLFGKERIFLKMSTQNAMDLLLQKKVKSIEFSSTLIKVHFRRSKMDKRRKQLIINTKKMQHSIRSFLAMARKMRKKKSVQIIERYWIKYHQRYFDRKKLPHILVIKRYIKARNAQLQINDKIQTIRKCKFLLLQMAKSNKQINNITNFREVKALFSNSIFDSIWKNIELKYLNNIQKYLKGVDVLRKNSKIIAKSEESCNYRLEIKYRKYLQKYLRGYVQSHKYQIKTNSIVTIQSWFRMLKVKIKYQSLRKNVVKLQRNWRKYYYDKQYNLKYTQDYFNRRDGESSIKRQEQYWKQILFRDYSKSSKNKEKGIEKLLFEYQKVKMDKISLFYYLLDFQILSPLSSIHPNYSWIQNYLTLYQQAWNKGNPIQMIEVSDQHTVCCTLNKVYIWGDYTLQDMAQGNSQRWKTIQSVQLPQGRIQKIHAHNKFTLVEMENDEPIVIGQQKYYDQDCSSKEWKTLSQSYVIINGVLLTLKSVSFSRLSINQKVVQLSCGMDHCIARTSLRKVFTWGDNTHGQLGLGHFKRIKKPKIMDFLNKHALTVHQVAASAYGSLFLDTNNRIWWWGTNGTITDVNFPYQCLLFQKSQFIDNPQKYTSVRLLTSWSKSISIIGVTIGAHEGIFKSSQNNIKRKTYQNLITKWNEDIATITPPYIQSISGYFQQKLMPKGKQGQDNKNKQLGHMRIKEKLLAELLLLEQTERTLLKEKKKY